jgi:hypothetical protein
MGNMLPSHSMTDSSRVECVAFLPNTHPAGSAIVNALGPIRQIVRGEGDVERRYLVIAPGTPEQHGAAVQIQKN